MEQLEEELKAEGGELTLPNSIYTVAICAGFFCDGTIWDAIETRAAKLASDAAAVATLGKDNEDKIGSTQVQVVGEDLTYADLVRGVLKNIWLMLVNAFVLLAFHYWLTFTVLYYLFAEPYDSDEAPWDAETDQLRMTYNNETYPWNFGIQWQSHFNQGECPTNFTLRGICAALFACFVYFDMLQTFHMLQWLFWAPHNKQAIAAGQPTSWFFPDELKVRITPR